MQVNMSRRIEIFLRNQNTLYELVSRIDPTSNNTFTRFESPAQASNRQHKLQITSTNQRRQMNHTGSQRGATTAEKEKRDVARRFGSTFEEFLIDGLPVCLGNEHGDAAVGVGRVPVTARNLVCEKGWMPYKVATT